MTFSSVRMWLEYLIVSTEFLAIILSAEYSSFFVLNARTTFPKLPTPIVCSILKSEKTGFSDLTTKVLSFFLVGVRVASLSFWGEPIEGSFKVPPVCFYVRFWYSLLTIARFCFLLEDWPRTLLVPYVYNPVLFFYRDMLFSDALMNSIDLRLITSSLIWFPPYLKSAFAFGLLSIRFWFLVFFFVGSISHLFFT